MAVTTATLRELHRIHIQLSELRTRLDRGPKQVRVRAGNLEALDKKLADVQEEMRHAKMTVDKKQLDLKASENKIVDWRTKLNACSSNKEYQALLDQIAAAEMANSVLSDEILETYEQIDLLEAKVKEAEQGVAAAQEQLAATKQEVAKAAESIQTDVVRLEGELATAEAVLPADFRVDYDRIVRSKGDDGLAPADDGVCTGCGQQITMNMVSKLTLGNAIFCKSCGRLLYLPEDQTLSR